MYLLIITGMSGAGKSHALRKLEDMNFFCVDNLPAALLEDFVESCAKPTPPIERAAVVMDVRERGFLGVIEESIKALKKAGVEAELLFLDARDEIIITRYKETRRVHPFSREGWIEEGIRNERRALAELYEMADHVIDTSDYRPMQLYTAIERALKRGEGIKFQISSFGYKYGIPLDADWMLDMRFVPNPFYIEELRPLTGKDRAVSEYVFGFEECGQLLEDVARVVARITPMYEREDKHTLSIAIGCTGGRHRSVAFAQALYEQLSGNGREAYLYHRDIFKDKQP